MITIALGVMLGLFGTLALMGVLAWLYSVTHDTYGYWTDGAANAARITLGVVAYLFVIGFVFCMAVGS